MTIFVSSHIKFDGKIISDDTIRKSILVGAYNHKKQTTNDFDFLDNQGREEVSFKNHYYSELTALYWIWKNNNSKIVGFEHYRRLFLKMNFTIWKYNLLNRDDILRLLKRFDIILPKKSYLKKKSLLKHYIEAGHSKILMYKTLDILYAIDKEFKSKYQEILNNNVLYNHNIFIAPKHLMDGYFEWIFNIFERLEKDTESHLLTYRSFGFLAERLFTLWVLSRNLKVKEIYIKKINLSKSAIYNNFMNFFSGFIYSQKRHIRQLSYKTPSSDEV